MNSRILVVVDMQREFPAHKDALPAVQKEIQKSIDNNEMVIVLEYARKEEGVGPIKPTDTVKTITKLLEKYGNVFYIGKLEDDGSRHIQDFLKSTNIQQNKRIKLCGVNGCCCVNDTLVGLKLKGYKNSSVLKHAIACSCCD